MFRHLVHPPKNIFKVLNFDLDTTFSCGQAFRWHKRGNAWEAVIHGRWVQLRQLALPSSLDVECSMLDVGRSPSSEIEAVTAVRVGGDWRWLADYLRLNDDFEAILATFPNDAPMRAAMEHCRGMRLVRQEPWECLASFILSSTKQVAQIQQCVRLICERFGEPVPAPTECGKQFAFPTPTRLAQASEAELRECKVGFRAKYLRGAAALIASGDINLGAIHRLPIEAAREQLMRCPGVGRKVADCALLFSCGFEEAFPIDVWIERALRVLYLRNRKVSKERMEAFAAKHFGPHRGYAQQYLFHHLRTTKWRG